ncbi:DNA/RNA polymerases superfamily protein [Gossypium australe]|uniref:DNA/RNA polymerases superfamily protein n=1 Tax=Gossypium australe TaxID=47621 RepID=A0A5B6UVH0_9ROSI|nr:DNA/RNA polymerases superfamily protein [Gossypium australe]
MIPEWKWNGVTMDFISGKDVIWVIVDRLTKSAHFIPVKTDYSLEKLAELNVSEIVKLHGVPLSIISDRDLRFTSIFWGKLHKALGSKLNFSIAFHRQTDGQFERIIQILEDMLRYQASIKMAPYKALYGHKCRSPLFLFELSEKKLIRIDLVRKTEEKKSYTDLKRKNIKFPVGEKVFLKVSPWKRVLQFGRKGKLSPRFIGPYEVLERIGSVAYHLALASKLDKIHKVFHVSMLQRYRSGLSHILSTEEIEL